MDFWTLCLQDHYEQHSGSDETNRCPFGCGLTVSKLLKKVFHVPFSLTSVSPKLLVKKYRKRSKLELLYIITSSSYRERALSSELNYLYVCRSSRSKQGHHYLFSGKEILLPKMPKFSDRKMPKTVKLSAFRLAEEYAWSG